MRIGIDIRPMVSELTGVGSYTFNLVRHLAQCDRNNHYTLFHNSFRVRVPFNSLGLPSNFEVKEYRIPNIILNILWKRLSYPPIEKFVKDIDIFHSPHSIPIPTRKVRLVVTIHDLYYLKHPEMARKDVREQHRRLFKEYISTARRIITVSHHSKKDIVELLDVEPDIVDVIYEGVDRSFRVFEEKSLVENVREKYGLPNEFILFVGTIEQRKNLGALINAMVILRDKKTKSLPLVMVGPRGWKADEILEEISSNGLDGQAKHIGYVSYEDMPLIYNAASLLVYPSLYEGFGLPPLEAMASGVPVIASNISSMPEVLGNAAIFVDPQNPGEIADSITMVLNDESLKNSLVEKGIKKAGSYSWEETSKNVIGVYEKVYRND